MLSTCCSATMHILTCTWHMPASRTAGSRAHMQLVISMDFTLPKYSMLVMFSVPAIRTRMLGWFCTASDALSAAEGVQLAGKLNATCKAQFSVLIRQDSLKLASLH